MTETTGLDKAAILLRTLGPQAADDVLDRLDPASGGLLRARMSSFDQAPPPQPLLEQVLGEFERMLRGPVREGPVTPGAKPAAEIVPEKPAARIAATPVTAAAVDPEETKEGDDPLEALRRLHPVGLALALQDEHPRTAALVLNCLETQHAGEVLKHLPPEQRRGVSLHLGQAIKGGPDLVRRIASALLVKSRALADTSSGVSGDARFKKMADMLRMLDKADRTEIIAALDEHDPETAAKIKELLYQIDDLLLVDDRSMQKLLAEIDSKSLATVLKGVSEQIREKVRNNLSKRARETLDEEMQFMGSVSPAQIQQAEKTVIEVIQRLDLAGELVMTAA